MLRERLGHDVAQKGIDDMNRAEDVSPWKAEGDMTQAYPESLVCIRLVVDAGEQPPRPVLQGLPESRDLCLASGERLGSLGMGKNLRVEMVGQRAEVCVNEGAQDPQRLRILGREAHIALELLDQ